MSVVAESLSHIRLDEPQAHQNLFLFPLLGEAANAPEYLLLEEALARGLVRVTEVSEGGSVPELSLVNEGERPVLLLDGEELVGAKQNRILNLSVLVGPHSRTVIPVSCVEAGRWRHTSEAFAPRPGQVGALFAINDRVVGLDLFDAPATLAKVLAKLVRSYALDALDEGVRPGEPARFDAEWLLERTRAAAVECFPAVGLGEDLRLSAPGLAGGALALDGRLVHLCAFALPGETGGTAGEGTDTGTRLVRASRRGWGRLA